jgi:hypothetical protein
MSKVNPKQTSRDRVTVAVISSRVHVAHVYVRVNVYITHSCSMLSYECMYVCMMYDVCVYTGTCASPGSQIKKEHTMLLYRYLYVRKLLNILRFFICVYLYNPTLLQPTVSPIAFVPLKKRRRTKYLRYISHLA